MCNSLACRTTSSSTGCSFTQGAGALEGTICDSGKVIKIE